MCVRACDACVHVRACTVGCMCTQIRMHVCVCAFHANTAEDRHAAHVLVDPIQDLARAELEGEGLATFGGVEH